MSSTFPVSAQEGTLFTPESWRELPPEARLAHLSLLLSIKHKNHSHESNSLLCEALHSARACVPLLHQRSLATPQGELVTNYHPDEQVVLSGGIEALPRAVAPLTAGCVVRIVGLDGDVPKELKEVLVPYDNGLDEAGGENSVDGDSTEMGERVALLIDETADILSIKLLLDSVEVLGSGTALFVHGGIFKSVEELSHGLLISGKGGISTTKVAGLNDAVEIVNKLYFDIACVYGDTNSVEDVVEGLTVPQVAVNISPTRIALTTDRASVLQYVHPQRVLRPFRSHLALLRHYFVGRFDNSEQIAREKASGGQRTAYAIHINDVIDEKIEGGPREGVFHLLEETYKYAPGERNPQIAPLLLRFEEIDGAIALSSMKAPEGVDNTALRNDNPCLWFEKGELTVSPSFPERQVYHFDESTMEFMIEVDVRISEMVRFRLSETLSRDRLVVSEKLWIGDKLKTGFYEEPFIYDRVHS